MRDLLSKLDAIVSETELKNPEDLQAKRNALADLEKDPVASGDPEISSAITQRKSDLEKEAKSKGFAESFEVGDEFGISFSEDHEIATTIVDILEDGIVIELDDLAMEMLTNEGLNFLEGELVEDKQKGVDGKACWKGYKRMGTKQKGGKTVDNCVKMEDHGPENPDAAVNYGEYDREGDMAKDDLRTIDDAVEELYSILRADDNLPEWVQSKITKAVDYIDTARDYMKAQKYEEGVAEDSRMRDFSRQDQLDHEDEIDSRAFSRLQNRITRQRGSHVAGVDIERWLKPYQILLKNNFKPKETGDRFEYLLQVALKLKGTDTGFDNSTGMSNAYKIFNLDHSEQKLIAKLIRSAPKTSELEKYLRDSQFEAAQAKTDDKLRQYYADLKAKKQAEKDKQQGVAEGDVDEAKYQGREVPLGKKMAGDVKKSKVYVRKPNGNIVKVNFGDKKMRIKKSNPARRKSFRARHNCANPGPRHKARYWSCRSW
jgi:hypothetical protein